MNALIDRLPAASYEVNAPLAPLTWFRAGGAADVLFRPAGAAQLTAFMRELADDIPFAVLGAGSNLLVRDGGVRGVVIHIGGQGFDEVVCAGHEIRAGAGVPLRRLARIAADAGLSGFEFMRGIPGLLGGAVRMNAGAYGRDMASVLLSAKILARGGTVRDVPAAELGLGYRRSALDENSIVLEARLRGQPAAAAAIRERMTAAADARAQSQPSGARTGGSTFKNPLSLNPPRKAWELIEDAGCRNLSVGEACVSPKHANFLMNTGSASACDIETLGEKIRARVRAAAGIELEWEIRRIGECSR